MVRIRMKSMGRRHRPFFRICAMDARTPRDGRAIEELGWYDPMVRNAAAREYLDASRVRYWLSVGAQPTEKVAAILKRHGVTKPGPGESWELPEDQRHKPAPPAEVVASGRTAPPPIPTPTAAPKPAAKPAPKAQAEPDPAEQPAQAQAPAEVQAPAAPPAEPTES
jgi:small subunit ribosomal protein S16